MFMIIITNKELHLACCAVEMLHKLSEKDKFTYNTTVV